MLSFKEFLMLKENINDKNILKAVFMAGASGSGKSTARTLLRQQLSTFPNIIDIDRIYNVLAKKNKLDRTSEETWNKIGDKVVDRSRKRLYKFFNEMYPMIIDGTSSNPALINRRYQILKALGYDVSMIYIESRLPLSMVRNSLRGQPDKEGRSVSKKQIEKSHKRLEDALYFYKNIFGENFYTIKNLHMDMDLLKEEISKIVRDIDYFFNLPVQNPIGQQHLQILRAKGGETLVPYVFTEEELWRYAEAWW